MWSFCVLDLMTENPTPPCTINNTGIVSCLTCKLAESDADCEANGRYETCPSSNVR